MKTKFIQNFSALLLPISFIILLFVLTTAPFLPLDKYAFGGTVLTGIALLITYAALKADKTSFSAIGFRYERKTPLRFTIGFTIGLLITCLILTIVIGLSQVELIYKSEANIPIVIFWLLAFFPLAFMEEIIFRGYAFMKINNSIGLWPAQILMALLFSWYHDFSGVTFFDQLLGPGIWALVFGIAAVWSKGLAFPTGLHMAINVVLALVGEKDSRHSIWSIEYTTEITSELSAQTDRIGLIMQIVILIVAIVLTEIYRKKKLKKGQN